jgi:tyrosyl-tRNA synthetase
MIQRDSVRDRLQNREQGISYTEFSYILLQSYDFAHLHKNMGVTLQMGGSDQWGNIVGGIDLIKKQHMSRLVKQGTIVVDPPNSLTAFDSMQPKYVFGLTAPLVTKSDGGKFGKTESGAIWLTADRTSPYAYYQFWLNTTDADVSRFLRIFTLLPKDEIERIEADHAKDPGQRIAQRTLAREATELLHGKAEMDHAENAAKALFSGDIASLPERLLEEVLSSAPSSTHDKNQLGGEGISLVDLLVETGLAKSKRESREFLTNGSISVNGRTVSVEDRANTTHLLHGKLIALRRGKKTWHVTRWA